jgi:hypothetical protein
MNRNGSILLCVMTLTAATLVSVVARPASAERPFNLRSLHGTYSVSPDGMADVVFSSGEGGRFRLAHGGTLAFITAVGDSDPTVLVHNGVFARQ